MIILTFRKHSVFGTTVYYSDCYENYRIICKSDRYYVQKDDHYVTDNLLEKGFHTVQSAENWIKLDTMPDILCVTFISSSERQKVYAALNTSNFSNNLSRVKSSNVWSIGLNIKNRKDKTGDLLVQFKSKSGGPGDVYMFYDVPPTLYRKWQSAPSKGHFFWKYIRNYYKYSKLTGDKHGKLPNAVS